MIGSEKRIELVQKSEIKNKVLNQKLITSGLQKILSYSNLFLQIDK